MTTKEKKYEPCGCPNGYCNCGTTQEEQDWEQYLRKLGYTDDVIEFVRTTRQQAVAERDAFWEAQEMGKSSDCEQHCRKAVEEDRERLRKKVEGMRKMGGEFGFCTHCKLHKGDFEHDYGTCAAYDDALDRVLALLTINDATDSA